jgi:hypothetical protein
MECLRDYITLTVCGGTSSTSGLSLDTLEFINLKAVSSIADDQQETFNGVMTDIQNRALLRIKNDLRAEFWKRYRIKDLLKSYNLKRDGLGSTIASPNTCGIYISQNNDEDRNFHAPFQSIFVQSVSIYASAVGSTTLKIIDLDTSEVIYTQALTLAIGWNVVNVETDLSGLYYNNPQRVYICFDGSTVDVTSKTMVNTIDEDSYCGLTIQGASTATKTITDPIELTDLTLGAETYGMTAVFSLRCSYDSVVCNNRELFKRAWLYCLGVEFVRELKATDRLNKYSIITKTQAADALVDFTNDYKESLMQSADGVQLSQSGCCIECNAPVRVQTTGSFFGT